MARTTRGRACRVVAGGATLELDLSWLLYLSANNKIRINLSYILISDALSDYFCGKDKDTGKRTHVIMAAANIRHFSGASKRLGAVARPYSLTRITPRVGTSVARS